LTKVISKEVCNRYHSLENINNLSSDFVPTHRLPFIVNNSSDAGFKRHTHMPNEPLADCFLPFLRREGCACL
jgi:hypothetical protein